MPIYEYKCPNGHLFEVFHGMSEPSPDRCEVCDAEPLERVLHAVAVHYKGSGFYSTAARRAATPAARPGLPSSRYRRGWPLTQPGPKVVEGGCGAESPFHIASALRLSSLGMITD